MTLRFTLGQVAKATNLSPETIKAWTRREMLMEDAVEGGGGPGQRRSFSFAALMLIAVANEILTRLRMRDTKFAFDAAMRFAFIGKAVAGYQGEVRDLRTERYPGLPFHHSQGRTILVVHQESSEVVLESELRDDPSLLFGVEQAVSVLVDLSKIFETTCIRLVSVTGDRKFMPRSMLDAVYPEAKGEF